MQRVYFLGGSTCCGKAPWPSRLCRARLGALQARQRPGAVHGRGGPAGISASARAAALSPEDTWMRSPEGQNREELAIYWEMFDQVCGHRPPPGAGAAGAGRGGGPTARAGAPPGGGCRAMRVFWRPRAFSGTYAKRPWVGRIVGPCSDPQRALTTGWRATRSLPREVLAQARRWGYPAMVVDGSRPSRTPTGSWRTASPARNRTAKHGRDPARK